MTVIYLVEDDESLRTALEIGLRAEGFRVHAYPTLATASRALELERPDLVVLDLGLPDGDGLDLCRKVRRADPDLPVLVLTARGTLESRLDGFRRGADDYLVKPFDVEELHARCRALLRRGPRRERAARVRIGLLDLDFSCREARRHGKAVDLTEMEWLFLRFLADREGRPVSRELLLQAIWGMGPGCRSRTIDTFASRLRKLVEPDPARPRFLLTVRGVGYRLELPSR
ncbi:MAG: response regulator transcription factor [Planctomycetes bacterium]|nr:response regulator transcription factor [Planctomycetota bacterium]